MSRKDIRIAFYEAVGVINGATMLLYIVGLILELKTGIVTKYCTKIVEKIFQKD